MMTKITDDFLFHARQQNLESFSYQNLYIFLNKIAKNYTFPIEIDGDKAIEICMKQTSFRRVVDNIVSNSEKYANNLYVSFYRDKESDIIIDFEDDGSGIDPMIISDIFHPFFTENKARTKTSDKQTNIGLGLSIVSDIVHDHGGTITAFCNSKKYGGARFTVVIPNGNVHVE
jgi:two-component system osmolarity sensor histidine kinase EnvZ